MVGRDREMLKDNYRLSRTAWLQPSNHQFLKGMAARVEACTDLDMNSAGRSYVNFLPCPLQLSS